jgi:hypothetical protein
VKRIPVQDLTGRRVGIFWRALEGNSVGKIEGSG